MASGFSNLVQRFEMMADRKTPGEKHAEKKVPRDKVGFFTRLNYFLLYIIIPIITT